MGKYSTKWYRKNEAEVMNRLGFKPTRNSGATWIDKGDGQSEHCLCELKSTDKESFSVKQSMLHTLEANAIEAHKLPVFALQFMNTDEIWLAVKESDIEAFKELIKASVKEEEVHEQKEKAFNKFCMCYFDESEEEKVASEERPDCFGVEDKFTYLCSECIFNKTCGDIIDIKREQEYNNTCKQERAKENLKARLAYAKQREKEREQRKEEEKKWKRALNKKG